MMVTGISSILVNERLKDKAAFLESSLMGKENRLKAEFHYLARSGRSKS